jgi:hypothetical protein
MDYVKFNISIDFSSSSLLLLYKFRRRRHDESVDFKHFSCCQLIERLISSVPLIQSLIPLPKIDNQIWLYSNKNLPRKYRITAED